MTTLTRRPAVLTGQHFMNGDTACAEGALAAGCTFFAGYPITPSTEVAERLALRLPEVGGQYIQMEDELASMAAIIGAAWGGARAMTATSGPGFSLMMENIGLAAMTETPVVVVNVMRGGPSTGLPTLVSQADVMQARWGSHGDYQPVAYAPASCQEMFDLTVAAFNTADALRIPVFILADEAVGHMTERVAIPVPEAIPRLERPRPPARREGDPPFLPFATDESLVPPMPAFGEGYHLHITGLTHDERGYPDTTADVHDRLVRRLNAKVERRAPEIAQAELASLEDAEVAVIAYGSTARSARRAVHLARQAGLRVGLFRPITLSPLAEQPLRRLGQRVRAFVVAELNLGQVAREVERLVRVPVYRVNHAGGAVLRPEQILDGIAAAGENRRRGKR